MNYFDQMADRQLTGAQKAKERAKAKWDAKRAEKAAHVPTELEKKMLEQAELAKLYRAWRREVKEEMQVKHGSNFKELMKRLWNLSWRDVPGVVTYVEGARWLRTADEETRLATLSYIGSAVSRARVRNGGSPLDDGIPMLGEEDSPEIKCRKILFGY